MKEIKRFAISILIGIMLMASGAVMSACTSAESGSGSGGQAAADEREPISEEEVKAIVLSKVPGAAESDITSFEKELDAGYGIYEGEISYKGIDYEFEIEAHSGNILTWEIDN